MNIFVTNDDGINETGIRELVKALHEKAGAKVFVCAPDGQRSAMSHSITMRETIYAEEVEIEGAEMAFVTSGTPADCVIVGLHLFRERGIDIDLLFAGINHCSNIGTDTIYSGTVGAATEGAIHHIPSAAVSVDTHHASHFEYACDLAVDTIKKTGGTWDSRIIININTPNLPKEEIRGVKYTVIGDREYVDDIRFKGTEGNKGMYRYGGQPVVYEGLPDTIDVIAMQDGYASITPLKVDMTAHEATGLLEEWRIGK
ncbi:MAG: 5'/3'-nucleotidase SurE [Firmicutes bacterium]|nr:5'/3'-nucleotidase SurE [Bacillota bacterium]